MSWFGKEWLDFMFQKQECEDFNAFMANRFLSFHDIPLAMKINRYTFWTSEPVARALFTALVPKQKTPFIRYLKTAKETERELAVIFDGLKKYYGWSERELELQMDFYLELFKDNNKVLEYLEFVGAPVSMMKQYGKNTEIQRKKTGLGGWF
jgi:hypothetical protein